MLLERRTRERARLKYPCMPYRGSGMLRQVLRLRATAAAASLTAWGRRLSISARAATAHGRTGDRRPPSPHRMPARGGKPAVRRSLRVHATGDHVP